MSDQEIAKMTGGSSTHPIDIPVGITAKTLSQDILFATLTKLFVSTSNENSLADILENIAFDLREMRLMMAVDQKSRQR
jgi:hypothetical protein